jgi:hypothetical protein
LLGAESDGGVPSWLTTNALAELGLKGNDLGERKAGMWPYATLAAGLIVVLIANVIFTLPS